MCLKNTHQPTRGVFFLMDDEKDIDDFRFFLIISEKPTHNRFLKKNAFVRSMGRRRRRRRDQNREEEEDEKQKEEEEESLCTRRLLFKCTTIQHTHTHTHFVRRDAAEEEEEEEKEVTIS